MLPAFAFAAPTAADAAFSRGVSAFQQGQYTAAVDYFNEARAAGLDKPSLYYNLGVSLYKLGRYREAEAAFRTCANDAAWRALAYYNMGLAAHERGERARAIEYFEESVRTSGSDNVRALATTMLERLGGVVSTAVQGTLAVDAGYNDNVTLTADNQLLQTTRESDAFLRLLATAGGRFTLAGGPIRWETSIYHVNYRKLDENNLTESFVGASKPIPLGDWRTEMGVEGEYLWLGGDRFQRVASLRLQAQHPLSGERHVRTRVRLSKIHSVDDDYDFLAGSRQEVDVSFGTPALAGYARAGLTVEFNDRVDLHTATEFYSYSPTRYQVWVVGSWPIGAQWRIEPSVVYYRSRYNDPDYRDTGEIATRRDEYLQLSLQTRYRLNAQWRVAGEYTYARNASHFSTFDYTQRVVSLGMTRTF